MLAASLVSAIGVSSSAALAQCPSLETTESSGNFTITAPSYFKMVFSNAVSGNLDEFYDLEQDPALDLAGGVEHRGLFYDARGTQVLINFWDDTAKTDAGKVDLLEATATRVRLRQEAFYKRLSGTTILQGLKGFGDYSIYPTGRLALRWNRKAFTSVDYRRCELTLSVHYQGSGPLSTWTPYTESGGTGFPHAGDRDFVLMKSDVPGSLTTDFLQVIYKDWTVANGYQKSATETNYGGASSGQELTTMRWRDDTQTTIPAGTSEVWNFLTYFKPTNFADHLDPAVTGRRDDYRNPDTLTINVGSAWSDPSESSASDHFNESEAAYVLDFDPAAGLDFVIDGGTGSPPTRYKPFFKIRQWRSLRDPSSVTLNGLPLTNDTDYQADVKPISRAHFAQDLLWHSTLEDQASVDASPDVGSPGTVNGTTTWEAAKYGQGFLFDAAGEHITFPSAGNFNLGQGSLDFWYQPRYAHTDGVRHVLWRNAGDASHFFLFEKTSANELKFTVQNGAGAATTTVTSSDYSWRNRDWVHLRVSWDAGAAAGLQARIFVSGTEPTHSDSGTYTTSGMVVGQNYVGSDSGGADPANGIIDELSIYDGPAGPLLLAYGGLTAHASEFLADGTAGKNQALPFVAINGQRQGEYFYLGADAEFRGLNVALATAGAGASPVLEWQYWNGTAWANLALNGDQTNHLTQTGTIDWMDPADWTPYSVQGGPDLFYVRAHLASGDYSTQAPVEGLIKTDILLFQYCSDITSTGQNFVFSLPTATAVHLAFFRAEGREGRVELSWQTASERDNLGFHLYRSTSREGRYERITAAPIPGLGTTSDGVTYHYRDADVSNGVTYFYRLEDIAASGETRLHGPVSATPGAEAGDSSPDFDPETSGTHIVWGDPEAVSLRVLERRARGISLELTTGGFYAFPRPDGSVRLHVPGFTVSPDPDSSPLPVKLSWVEALAGRKVEIASVEASDVVSFPGVTLAGHPSRELHATSEGVIRADSIRARRSGRGSRGSPAAWARIVETGFQGDLKKALVELAPLRWDSSPGRLRLAKRIVVELLFSGREPMERSGADRGGRRHRETGAHSRRRVVARLSTRERGLYAVRFEDVFGRRAPSRDAASIRMSRLGEPEAFHVEPRNGTFAPGSTLFFFSEGAALNPYGDEAVFELEEDSRGALMPVVSAPPWGEPMSFHWSRLEREENRYYQATLLDAPDRWLWDVLFAPMVKSYFFELHRLSPSPRSSLLQIWLQGTSDLPASPDHHIRVHVNGRLVAEEYLEGREARGITVDLGPGVLRDGMNEIALENVGDTDASSSVVMLDRFELTYPRSSRVEKDTIEASFLEPAAAEFSGLGSGAHVLDVTESPARWLSGFDASGPSLRFRAEAGRSYLVVDREAVLRPEIRKPLAGRLKNQRYRFDYLMIGPNELLEPARPLLELRSRQGLRPLAVPLQEVYAEFGFGEERPEALREFLSYAYHHWSSPPRYVLLVGDATYDYKGYLEAGPSHHVPPLLIRTSYLWTASDPTYASVNGEDVLPDLAIGRLPAATPKEARTMVEKILAYEMSASPAASPVVLVADNPDRAGNFVADADEIASGLPAARPLEKIYLSELGTESTRAAVARSFDSGAFLMSYIGHGGIHLWADENIFDLHQVSALLPQPEQPILLTMNCLNGYFHFPYFNSLAEELLKAEGKGVIAAFSPSGMSLDAEAHLYHQALVTEIFHRNHDRLGDAVLAAQSAYASTGAFPELLSIYHLLGDPALRLR